MSIGVIGGYEILRRIGGGGMAEVFEAHRVGFGGFQQRVALKCIRPELASDPKFVQQFINEANLGSKLQHPNIVAVQDFNQVDGMLFLAMEFVEGADLQGLISHFKRTERPFPPALAAHIAACILAALGCAHSHTNPDGTLNPVIHRDVKPPNVMLTRQGLVKLADFGIAKAAAGAHQTQTEGTVKGSLAYMSPEQLMTREVTPISDLFAVGVVLYEMLMLERLFVGEPFTNVIYKITSADIENELKALRAEHPAFYPIVAKALERLPEDRYQDAESFREAVRPLAAGLDSEALIKAEVDAILKERRSFTPGMPTDNSLWPLTRTNSSSTLTNLTGLGGVSPGQSGMHTLGVQTPLPPPAPAASKVPWVIAGTAIAALGLVAAYLSGRATPTAAPASADVAASPEEVSEPVPTRAIRGKMVWARGAEMVEIPGGPFLSGQEQKPAQLSTFYIDRFEVTNSQYLEFLSDCPPGSPCAPSATPSYLQLATPAELASIATLPVTSVTWEDAMAYAHWAGKELPTAQQWEKAARGVDGREYPWGNDQKENVAWVSAPVGFEESQPLGLGSTSVIDPRFIGDMSPFGVVGMGGNVSEWTRDPDPSFPKSKVMMGGSWSPGRASAARIVRTQTMGQSDKSSSVGFRCVLTEADAARFATPLTIERVKSKALLRIGAETSSSMVHKKADGSYDGFEYGVASAIAGRFDAKVGVVEGQWGRLPGMLLAQNFDILMSGYVPDARIKGVAWSLPYLEFGLALVTRRDSRIRSVADLKGMKVGIFEDPAAERAVKGLVPASANLVKFDAGEFKALAEGRIDAVIYDAPFAVDEVASSGGKLQVVAYNLNRSSYHIGVRQGEWSMLQRINAAIPEILASEEYQKLITTWLGGPLAYGILGFHPGARMYQVRAGDSLNSIAARELGSAAQAATLQKLNKAWLKDPRQLRTGMFLRLPGKPEKSP